MATKLVNYLACLHITSFIQSYNVLVTEVCVWDIAFMNGNIDYICWVNCHGPLPVLCYWVLEQITTWLTNIKPPLWLYADVVQV